MVTLATKTLDLIDKAIASDQGAAFRKAEEIFIPKMEDAYRGVEKPFRSHLGASSIGRDCTRELWYNFNWATRPIHESRILRLFNRGHLEEARFLAMLSIIGVQLWYETEDGGQFKFSDHFGHFGSALDGVVVGIPELPSGTPALTEFKTSSDKYFKKMQKDGVRKTKFDHYAQVQVCMHKMQLPFCLYMMVNKNDDSLYAEIIPYDRVCAEMHLDKAEIIIFSPNGHKQVNPAPGWYQCKFCDHKAVCKGSSLPDINCRTCLYSRPDRQGAWECDLGNDEIFKEAVFSGCSDHLYNPQLLNVPFIHGVDKEKKVVDLTLQNGERILHGPEYVTSPILFQKGLK